MFKYYCCGSITNGRSDCYSDEEGASHHSKEDARETRYRKEGSGRRHRRGGLGEATSKPIEGKRFSESPFQRQISKRNHARNQGGGIRERREDYEAACALEFADRRVRHSSLVGPVFGRGWRRQSRNLSRRGPGKEGQGLPEPYKPGRAVLCSAEGRQRHGRGEGEESEGFRGQNCVCH